MGIGVSHLVVLCKYSDSVCLWNAGIGKHTTQVTLEQLVQRPDLRPLKIGHYEIEQGLVIDEQDAFAPVYVNQVGMPGAEIREARLLSAQVGRFQAHFLLEPFCATNKLHYLSSHGAYERNSIR